MVTYSKAHPLLSRDGEERVSTLHKSDNGGIPYRKISLPAHFIQTHTGKNDGPRQCPKIIGHADGCNAHIFSAHLGSKSLNARMRRWWRIGCIHGEADGYSNGDGVGNPLGDAAAQQGHHLGTGQTGLWVGEKKLTGGCTWSWILRPNNGLHYCTHLIFQCMGLHNPLTRQHTFRG